MALDARAARVGFYVTRYVEAAGPAAAARRAEQEVRRDPRVAEPPEAARELRLTVDEVERVAPADVPPVRPGFAFFMGQ